MWSGPLGVAAPAENLDSPQNIREFSMHNAPPLVVW